MRPPVVEPLPMVVDASAIKPPFHAVRVVVDCPYAVVVHGHTDARVSVPPRATDPVPESPPPFAMVMVLAERRLVPMVVVDTRRPF